MKNLFLVSTLVVSSISFAGFQPECDSGEYDKWSHCADNSPTGQSSYHIGSASCLKPCSLSFEEMVDQAQANAQDAANLHRFCGFNQIRSSDWEAPIASSVTEGHRTWITVKTSARFTCKRF